MINTSTNVNVVTDPEVAALETAYKALAAQSYEAQGRMMQWLRERLASDNAAKVSGVVARRNTTE
jgi:hypothetical protein